MTAPAATAESVLRRADRQWCREAADDPIEAGRMRMLVDAVQAVLDDARVSAATADTAELDQPDLKPLPLPCSCGQPWPLNRPPDLATVVPHRKPKGSQR